MIKRKARKGLQAYLFIQFIRAMLIGISIGYPSAHAGAAEACKEWVAKAVSIQGSVQARRAGEARWLPVRLNDTYCPGDMIRVQERSRAAVVLRNEVLFRLDQKTTVTFSGLEREKTSLLDLLLGSAHFFSRIPRGLKVITPFVNAAVEGTEFFMRVGPDQVFLSVFEGQVTATNEAGSLTLIGGQAALARVGDAPVLRIEVRSRDAVQWALYYPPILDYRPADFPGGAETDWPAMMRRSIELYWMGDMAGAFSSLEGAPEGIRDPRFFTYRAALSLTVGRVEEARVDIERALALDPSSGHAFALQSVIAVVQNEKERALELARKAVERDPKSPAARVALSYAQQAHFDLNNALASLQEAVGLDPANALARARLSELWLSVGDLGKALDAAREAVALNPYLARTQTVLGFAFLTQIETREAKSAFEKAIVLDPADPLPRLGLGLAKIREGEVKAGRSEIEIAVILDPNNGLIRSYLGKAYFEEKRDKLGMEELAMAKALDPKDPTPWYYDAIRRQTVNRPVEALQDLQRSIELNDNRAPYRSRLLLDDDLAARSASLGRIYRDLGFQQLALVEGWKSLNTDPSNYSAHRFLADSYAALPRHEIARVSELLQAQLLQPLNITPIQPQLAESDLSILEGAGPSDPAFNEFNPLFHRNRLALQPNGFLGENGILGNDIALSAIWGMGSYSIGQYHYETEGFRENNDLKQDIYNVFAQMSLTPKTSIQAEFRSTDEEKGDLTMRFDPQNFSDTLRQENQKDSIRLGLHHAFTSHSDLIASVIYQDLTFGTDLSLGGKRFVFDTDGHEKGYIAEARYLFHQERFSLTTGTGHFDVNSKLIRVRNIRFPGSPVITLKTMEDDNIRHTNFYLYSLINYPNSVTWTIGGSFDLLNDVVVRDRDQVNPKFGLTWNLLPGTTFRAAIFRALEKQLISNQTIEPTQVAGFNQFFEDGNGTESWRYGVAIDHKFSAVLYGGSEFSRRELELPFITVTSVGSPEVSKAGWEENLVRTYLYWTPYKWLALSGEYYYERMNRDIEATGVESLTNVDTHWFSLGINFFHPSGFSARLKTSYIDQDGSFMNSSGAIVPGKDNFWLVDAFVSYRLPKRLGLITFGIKNLFDKNFKFQSTDRVSPKIIPESLVFARFTLSF